MKRPDLNGTWCGIRIRRLRALAMKKRLAAVSFPVATVFADPPPATTEFFKMSEFISLIAKKSQRFPKNNRHRIVNNLQVSTLDRFPACDRGIIAGKFGSFFGGS